MSKQSEEVKIIKTKNGVPTVIEVFGKKYQLQHVNQFRR